MQTPHACTKQRCISRKLFCLANTNNLTGCPCHHKSGCRKTVQAGDKGAWTNDMPTPALVHGRRVQARREGTHTATWQPSSFINNCHSTCCAANCRVAVRASDEGMKWLEWPEYLSTVQELRRECAGRNHIGSLRARSAVAWSLQRYLIFAILSSIPDRSGSLHTPSQL